jgi:hypothetical protein
MHGKVYRNETEQRVAKRIPDIHIIEVTTIIIYLYIRPKHPVPLYENKTALEFTASVKFQVTLTYGSI